MVGTDAVWGVTQLTRDYDIVLPLISSVGFGTVTIDLLEGEQTTPTWAWYAADSCSGSADLFALAIRPVWTGGVPCFTSCSCSPASSHRLRKHRSCETAHAKLSTETALAFCSQVVAAESDLPCTGQLLLNKPISCLGLRFDVLLLGSSRK